MPTDGAVRHIILKGQVRVLVDRDLHLCERELLILARELGGVGIILGRFGHDAFSAELGLSLQSTLPSSGVEGILTVETLKVQAAEIAEAASTESAPVEALLLSAIAAVVGVLRVGERFGAIPAILSNSLLCV